MYGHSGHYLVDRPGNRKRLQDALSLRFTGEVPFFESHVAVEHVNTVMGRPMNAAMRAWASSVIHDARDEYGQEVSTFLPPADYIEFLQRTGIDTAYVFNPWFLGRRNERDSAGVISYVDGTIKSRSDLNRVVVPSLDRVERLVEGFLEAAHDTELGIAYAIETSAGISNTAVGPTDCLLKLYDDPAFIHELMDRIDEYVVAQTECLLQYPIDVFWLSGPRAAKAGPMISPAMHEEFIFPRLEKIMDIVRPSGIPVTLHVDGDFTAFMDWILETGFAAIHPFEPGAVDIYAFKETYGDRICLYGNIDLSGVLVFGTAEEVVADTEEHIRRLAPGGGYICASSHEITAEVPFENFRALARTVCDTTVGRDGSLGYTIER